MPSPHSSSSHSSSSHSSSSSSGSSRSSGSSSSHSSGHSSWSSSRSSGSSYDSWDHDSGSDSNIPASVQLVLLIITVLIVLGIYLYNKNVSSVKTNAQTSPVIVAEGQSAVWDAEYGGYVMKRFVQYSDGKREYFPIEKATEKTGEDNSWVTFHNGSAVEQKLSDLELFGREIHLTERVPGVWRITENGGKTLVWDDGEQSYHDADSELWLWYNTDVDPALWQYWYEPISGHYGSYGWMEYENETWYIETSQGNWIEVPEKYDTSPLWHIETDD